MIKTAPQITLAVLALSFVSCTVAPVLVFAEEVVTITSEAHASVSTGNQNGQDGKNGQDGEDGTNGAPGKAGVSITNVAPGATGEVVTIKTTTNGVTVLDQVTVESIEVATATVATSSTVVAAIAARHEETGTYETTESRPLAQLFAELQLIIFTYVSYLF